MPTLVSELSANLQEHLTEYPEIFGLKMVGIADATNYMTPITDVDDKIPLLQLVVGDPLQPGNRGAWAPKSGIANFKDRIPQVKNIELPLLFTESELEAAKRSHLQKLDRADDANPYSMPFEAVILGKILNSASDNLRRKTFYKGVLNAAGTTSLDLFNGVLTIIAAEIVSGAIPAGNVFAGAAIDNTNALEQFEGVADNVPSEYWTDDWVVLASPENIKNYSKDYQSTNGALPYNDKFEKRTLEGTNWEMIPEIGMSGSDRIIATPRGNICWILNNYNNLGNLNFWPNRFDLEIAGKFKACIDYAVAELMYMNNQN